MRAVSVGRKPFPQPGELADTKGYGYVAAPSAYGSLWG